MRVRGKQLGINVSHQDTMDCISRICESIQNIPKMAPLFVFHVPRPPVLARPSKMAWTCSAASNAGLIANLQRTLQIRTPRVRDAMLSVDRATFVPETCTAPYADCPEPLSHNATISAPHMHAAALELLLPYITPTSALLDVGAGSGYLAAALANLAPRGSVTALEHVPALAALAVRNLDAHDAELQRSGRVAVRLADGRLGARDRAPFAAIHVGAAAETVPPALVAQLAAGGAMVVPVGERGEAQRLLLVTKDARGRVEERAVLAVRYVPLCDLAMQIEA